ncbi:MAG: hypothetical protein WD468_06795 [Pirellulales bacterium]
MAGKRYGRSSFWCMWLLGSLLAAEWAHATPPGLIGDYNNNGTVDAADFVLWREYLTQNVTLPNRDPANSGVIAASDFNSWKSNFGFTESAASSMLEIINEATVPNAVTSGVPIGVACDYNENGVCDAADYVVWRNHLGEPFQLPNEGTNVTPGTVTVEDYMLWREKFGQTIGDGSVLVDSNSIVPEPSSAGLAILGALVFFGALKSRRA